MRTLRFHQVDNGNIICFSKSDPGSGEVVLVVCALASYDTQIGTTALDMTGLGLDWPDRFSAVDELTGALFEWGQFNYVELGQHREVAHVLRLIR